ncbi:MAG: universal stress protein [Saprospiraceae bacterium]|nr:universal stress protein [Saprospiraceae bacterium]
MKSLLVPTDFSKPASTALKYAIHLANAFGGKLDIVHFYKTIEKAGQLKSMDPILRREAEDQMHELVETHRSALNEGVNINTHIYEGYPAAMLAKLSEQQNVDLIVMGTQGASRAIDVFLGSTACAVVRKTSTPTLIIPGEAEFSPIRSVVFAMDNRELEGELLSPLRKLCGQFSPSVHLFNVSQDDSSTQRESKLDEELDNCACTIVVRDGEDVIEEIGNYSKEINADLIVMVRHSKSFFAKIFQGSHTKKEIFRTEVPLLILHD